MGRLDYAETLADNIFKRVDYMLTERQKILTEIKRIARQEKAFVQAWQNEIINRSLSALITAKLEHMLMTR